MLQLDADGDSLVTAGKECPVGGEATSQRGETSPELRGKKKRTHPFTGFSFVTFTSTSSQRDPCLSSSVQVHKMTLVSSPNSLCL